jgi:hypothetical protein
VGFEFFVSLRRASEPVPPEERRLLFDERLRTMVAMSRVEPPPPQPRSFLGALRRRR